MSYKLKIITNQHTEMQLSEFIQKLNWILTYLKQGLILHELQFFICKIHKY